MALLIDDGQSRLEGKSQVIPLPTFWIIPTPSRQLRSLFPHTEAEVPSSRVQPNTCSAPCLMPCTGRVIKAHRSPSRSSVLHYSRLFPRFHFFLFGTNYFDWLLFCYTTFESLSSLLFLCFWQELLLNSSSSATPRLRLFLPFRYCTLRPNYIGTQAASLESSFSVAAMHLFHSRAISFKCKVVCTILLLLRSQFTILEIL